jgi:hypothetical protein
MGKTNINISSAISPDILKTISASTAIKTFGDQLTDKSKEKIISVAKGKAGDLTKQIEEVVVAEIKVHSDHGTELKRLDILLKQNQISNEQYNEAVIEENKAYNQKLADLKLLKQKYQQDLTSIITDPYKKIKDDRAKRKAKRLKRKERTKAEKTKARRDRAKKVALNTAKTLAPVIALQIANKYTSILSQRAQLEILVDQVNVYIESVNNSETAEIATNLRNNTIALINSSIAKLSDLKKLIQQINLYVTIFNAIVTVLSSLPLPTAVPPGIGVPVSLIAKIIRVLEKANKLISALSIILSISTIALENEINNLNELIARLKQINIDTLDQQQLSDLSNTFLPLGNNQFPPYKGFNFQIKEEQNQAFVVKGNKRRYAVAIDRYGVETIKSELSFTLDPNDLIEQLKLVIDQRNLQG